MSIPSGEKPATESYECAAREAHPPGLCCDASSDRRGAVTPRTRVDNMNVSLDGYAAGEHVTFDAPIGGAERLHRGSMAG